MQMLSNLRSRRDREAGFTLIELMVVVLIIAILIAIAIPTFLGARTRAQDKAAQSNLRNGITSAKTIFTDQQDYALATPTALAQVEPSLNFQDNTTASTQPKEISVKAIDLDATLSGSEEIVMTSKSKSGACFAVADVQIDQGNANLTGTGLVVGTQYNKLASGSTCDADTAAALTTGWSDSF